MLEALPIAAHDRVLDVACGDGMYSVWLTEALGSAGMVCAVDVQHAWLIEAKRQACASALPIHWLQGDAQRLPLADDQFDIVWCAQCLYSLPQVDGALAELKRVTRPGGVIAVLENDTLHHLLFPWPIELELEVRAAELAALHCDAPDAATRYYVGRNLGAVLHDAGLTHVVERAWATTRQAPFLEAERVFLAEYLKNLRDRVAARLSASILKQLDRLVSPGGEQYLLDRCNSAIVCLDRLVWGVKPGTLS